jgi:hypothetical protein
MTPPLTPDLESLKTLLTNVAVSSCSAGARSFAGTFDAPDSRDTALAAVRDMGSALVSLYARIEAAESELRAAHEERDEWIAREAVATGYAELLEAKLTPKSQEGPTHA